MRWAALLLAMSAPPMVAHAQLIPEGAKPCFSLYFGLEAPANAAAARTCFETEAAQGSCDDVANLNRLYLATMYLDGQGGPVDFARARTLIAGCQTGTRKPIEEEIATREEITIARGKSPLDYCETLAVTTVDSEACGQLADWKVSTRTRAAETAIRRNLDDPARQRFDLWSAAFLEFARYDAAWRADRFRGGTIRSLVYSQRLNDLRREHLETLVALPNYAPGPAHTADAAIRRHQRLEGQYQSRLSAAPDETNRNLLRTAQQAWERYYERAAVFYAGQAGPNSASVEQDIRLRLTSDRMDDLVRSKKAGEP